MEEDIDGNIIIEVDFPISEFRKVSHWGCEVSDCATIYDMFIEVIRPMLISMGYTPGSIIDGCREYLVEFANEDNPKVIEGEIV